MEVETAGSKLDGYVRLRVGGEMFEASTETLGSEPGSLFEVMLNGSWTNQYDASGAIVFDRDPKRFRVLLNFLRTRELVLEDGVTAEGVRLEAEYFQIEDAVLAAEKMQIESDTPSLLKLIVDSRCGKLLRASEDQSASFPADLSFEVLRPSLITVNASFSKLVGLRPEVLLEGNRQTTHMVSHITGNGSTIRAIGKVEAGRHQVRVTFHVVPEEDIENIRSPHKKDRGHVHGPARLEVWRYPFNEKVQWTDAFDVANPERNARRQVDMWLCGQDGENASSLAEAVGAISASVYN